MAEAITASGKDAHRERSLAPTREPDNSLPGLIGEAFGPHEGMAAHPAKATQRLVWRWSDGDDDIDQRQDRGGEVIRLHGHQNRLPELSRQGLGQVSPLDWQ